MLTRLFLALFLACFAAPAQNAPSAVIEVTGAVKEPLKLSASDLSAMPRASLKVQSEGREIGYDGVWLYEVLKRAGVAAGSALRGKALSSYVLAEATDGYQVVFSLAEIDPAFQESQILVADQADGKPLSGSQGPFRLVVPKDKPGARSVRMLTRLEVVQLRK